VREVTDRNRSERKVGLQADVLDQVDAAVKRWAPDGTVVHWNRGAERLYGYSAEETLGRPLRDLIWPQGGDERAAELRREVTERGEFEGELALRRKDGSTFTAYSRIVGVRNSEGGLDGFVGIAVDATERRRAREELEHSRERFRAQYKSLPIPTYTWRREGEDFVLVDFNDAAYRFTEGHIADLLGAHASELHGHDPKILAELREALVATGSLSREIDFPMPSIGQTRRLAMTYVHVPPNVVMVHAEDVTARRRTEVRLRFQAELLDRVDAAVVALDTEGTITHWNRCAQEFYGFSEAEAVGASISDLVARVDVEDREALLERIGTGEGPWEVEFKLRRADGEVIPVYARNATVRGSGGEIIGYVGVWWTSRSASAYRRSSARPRFATALWSSDCRPSPSSPASARRAGCTSPPRSSRCSGTRPRSGRPTPPCGAAASTPRTVTASWPRPRAPRRAVGRSRSSTASWPRAATSAGSATKRWCTPGRTATPARPRVCSPTSPSARRSSRNFSSWPTTTA
jgi:PAS domain S-box-containing protein